MKRFICLSVILTLLVLGFNTASAVNMLTNGGFESPVVGNGVSAFNEVPTGWTQSSGGFWLIDSTWVQAPIEGSQFIQTGALSPVQLTQSMTLTPGQTYTVSLKYTGDGGGKGTRSFVVRTFDIVDSNSVNISDRLYSYSLFNQPYAPDWQSVEFVILVSDGATSTSLSILGDSSYMWVDDVQVVAGGVFVGNPDFPCFINSVADINGDCVVGFADFAELAANWLANAFAL